jgi:hypothetical protein
MGSFWTWLNTPPVMSEVLDPFGLFCLLLLVPGFVVSAYLAGPGAHRLAKDPVQLAGVRYWASIGLWVFGAGLFFFGARVMQINPLSFGEPKWLLCSIIVIVFAAARCLDWWRTDYPAKRARCVPADTVYPLTDPKSHVSSARPRQTISETIVRR